MTTYIVKMGDSLQTIATRYDVNWQEIASVNELVFPYIDSENVKSEYADNDHIAKIGTQLLIPIADNINAIINKNKVTDLNERILGADLDIYTELFSTPHNMEDGGMFTDDGNGDLKLAVGINNLSQQVLTKLQTEIGSLHLHPKFGTYLTRYVGKRGSQELLTKIVLEIRKSVLSDPRVIDMSPVKIYQEGVTISCSFTVYPINPYTAFSISGQLNI